VIESFMIASRYHVSDLIAKLGYGAWGLAGAFGAVGRETAIDSILAYLEAGGSFIDTARVYGASEALIGDALAVWDGPAPRVATKIEGLGPLSSWGRPEPSEVVFPPGQIRASLEASLRDLRLERVELVQLHLYWPTWGTDGRWLDELHELRAEGKAGAIGVSLPDYRHDLGLPLIAARSVDSIQTVVNIFDPLALDCLAPLAAAAGISIIARGILDEGGLTDAAPADRTYADDDFRHRFFQATTPQAYEEHLIPLRALIPEHARSIAELAIRFVLSRPEITVAVTSMQTRELVEKNVAAAAVGPLDIELVDALATRHRWTRNFFDPLYWAD
jgi:methylglyoxal reductase